MFSFVFQKQIYSTFRKKRKGQLNLGCMRLEGHCEEFDKAILIIVKFHRFRSCASRNDD